MKQIPGGEETREARGLWEFRVVRSDSHLGEVWRGRPLSGEKKAELACSRWRAGTANSRPWGRARAMERGGLEAQRVASEAVG